MSKRIPVYLSKEELEELLVWKDYALGEGYMKDPDFTSNLVERVEAELETFEE